MEIQTPRKHAHEKGTSLLYTKAHKLVLSSLTRACTPGFSSDLRGLGFRAYLSELFALLAGMGRVLVTMQRRPRKSAGGL